ncbi:MAG: sucrose phosphorylase, partial [Acidimicrobiia bacterium]|nr:sucrose phosphorylase [Acidimicrobiia bacterium]
MFMRSDKVWPQGDAPTDHLRRLFLRRPHSPFLEVPIGDGEKTEVVWATFGTSAHESEQIDLDWRSMLTQDKYREWFTTLAQAGVAEVRLDAVGYLVKQAGSSCFMVEPEIWDALQCLRTIADGVGLQVLPEVHAVPDVVAGLDAHGYCTYDFVLPGLLLDALRTRSTGRLAQHLSTLAPTRVTMLDCHDGIPISPDLVGIVPEPDLLALTARLEDRGANVNRILGAAERGIDFDVHQINISYVDAADGADGLVLARAVQLFSPGRPQVYYQGLLGGGNDHAAVERTGEGRAINRTDYTIDEARHALRSVVAQRQRRLLEIRSRHPAFVAERPSIDRPHDERITLRWEHDGDWCQLDADVGDRVATITMSPFPGLD